jgi:hypothetical protein
MTTCFADALKLGGYNTCAKLVTNDFDGGVGSLRHQIACATHGDTIKFATTLALDTIFLYTAPIVFQKNITLKNVTGSPIYLSGRFSTPLVQVNSGTNGRIENLRLLGKEEKIINNLGTLTLKNAWLKRKNMTIWRQSSGSIFIEGATDIK